MIKHACSIASSVLWVGLALIGVPTHAADAPARLLDELEKRRESLQSVRLVRQTVVQEGPGVRESVIELWEQRAGDRWKSRMASTITPGGKDGEPGRVVRTVDVSDGRSNWHESPLEASIIVVKSAYARESAFEPVRERIRMGKARIGRRETVNGLPCALIEVSGRESGTKFVARYWITEEHGVILKSTLRKADRGKMEMTTLVLKVNEKMDDSVFRYRPPEGAIVIDSAKLGGKTGRGSKP